MLIVYSEDTIIIMESDSESSATDIVQQEFKTELNGDAVDYETSSDSADLVPPKRVRFKSGTKSGEQQSGTVRSDRPKAKTKQRRRSSDIRKYFTPEKAKKSKRSPGIIVMESFEPPRGKTNNVVSEQVRHKPACTSIEKS